MDGFLHGPGFFSSYFLFLVSCFLFLSFAFKKILLVVGS